jgi:hypothetical protein
MTPDPRRNTPAKSSPGSTGRWWRNGPTRSRAQRGEDYRTFKAQVEDKMFALFEAYFPELAKLVVFRNLSTPLTTQAITGHHKGAFYGIDTTPDRLMSEALQTRTPVPGLFLAGQDVLTPASPGRFGAAFWLRRPSIRSCSGNCQARLATGCRRPSTHIQRSNRDRLWRRYGWAVSHREVFESSEPSAKPDSQD